MESSRVLSAID